MKVLLTGANGLLGRELAQRLATQYEVVGLVRSEVESPVPGIEYVRIDLAQPLVLDDLPARVDIIVHLAQSSRFRDFPDGARDTFYVNVSSTLDLLEYSRNAGVKKFFLASTGGVYENQMNPIDEAGALLPQTQIGLYFASKLSAEMIASTYRQYFEVSVLRFFFMFGTRQRADMFLPRLVQRVITGEPIQIDSRGGIRVNPIHVSDAALLVTRLIDVTPPQFLNVAGSDVVSIQEIGEVIGKMCGKPVRWENGAFSSDIVADVTAMSAYLPRQEMTPFRDGLRSLVDAIAAQY